MGTPKWRLMRRWMSRSAAEKERAGLMADPDKVEAMLTKRRSERRSALKR